MISIQGEKNKSNKSGTTDGIIVEDITNNIYNSPTTSSLFITLSITYNKINFSFIDLLIIQEMMFYIVETLTF